MDPSSNKHTPPSSHRFLLSPCAHSIPFYCTFTDKVQGLPVLDGAYSLSANDFLVPPAHTLWISVSDAEADISCDPPLTALQCASPLFGNDYDQIRERGSRDGSCWIQRLRIRTVKHKTKHTAALVVLWCLRWLEMLLGTRYDECLGSFNCWVSWDRKLAGLVLMFCWLWRRAKSRK